MATRHVPVSVTPFCNQTFGPWSDLTFLQVGVPLGQVSRHVVVSTDASAMGWWAMCNGHAAAGLWDPTAVAHQLPRVASSMLALRRFKTLLHDKHVLVRTDNTATVAYINHQVYAPVASRPPSPPLESEASEVASHHSCPRWAQLCSRWALILPSGRMATPPRGSSADWETLRGRSGKPVCLPGHVPLPAVLLLVRGDPRHRCAGTQLASGPMQICISSSEPSRTDPVQGQGGRGASPFSGALLAQSDLVPRTDAPCDSSYLANSSEEGSPFSERGHPLAPASRLVESPRVVPGRGAEVLGGLPLVVVNTLTSAWAPSTRHSYRPKWKLFVEWCSSHQEDPLRCPIRIVLFFLQDGLERRLSPSTLKVATIATHRDSVDGKSVGKHDLVIRFLRGARWLNVAPIAFPTRSTRPSVIHTHCTDVPSPQLLYHRCMAGAQSLGSSAKNWCPFCGAGCAWRVTFEWLGSRARSHYVSQSDVTSPFPSSGNEGYVCNVTETLSL